MTADYLCEACAHFDADGDDGNHPGCLKQGGWGGVAIRLGERCPYGYEFGVPICYPVHQEEREARAREIKAKMDAMAMGGDRMGGGQESVMRSLELLSAAGDYVVEDVGGLRYWVEPKDGLGGSGLAAEFVGGEWSFYVTGVYNSGSDYAQIDVDGLERLREFCGMLSGGGGARG